jgi:signal transduction histidine kinase
VLSGFLFYSEILLRILPEQDYAVRLEALAEALPLEVAATDASGRVIVWNAALATVAGPRDHAVGRHLLDALPALAQDANLDWAAELQRVLHGGSPRTFARHPLGPRVLRATVAPMRGVEGRILGAVLCFEDITRGAREEERRRIRERSDAVTALGAGIAHEIRNPVNALSLKLQLLREQLSDPAAGQEELTAKADATIAELGRIDALVQNLLEVSRGGPPVCEDEHIDEIVREVLAHLEGAFAEATGHVTFSPGSRRALPLERARIYRAIHNIVENAMEAAGPGGHVWIATRDDPHSTVVVVDDDGPGIDPADRGRVLELFYTRKRGGTGLGLPLARRAVESHGGDLEILDRPGGGARFVIHLPIREGEEVASRPGGAAWPAS